ncbi:MAG: response regulator transcription factor [Eubacteriales bacterium]|nr:response regulator transcription factor [Eubacteriales bacterium]
MIYVVEDDQGIRELESYALRQAGYEVDSFEEGASFFAALEKKLPRLVLLDVMLPGDDGFAILKKLKENSRFMDIPVLMVTAKDMEMDKVRGLDGGADDYVVKPFGVMELLSRVKAVLRRSAGKQETEELCIGGLRLDDSRRKVLVENHEISLTYMEYELLHFLMLNRGMALSRERLLDAVWGMDYVGDTRTVDVHVRALRVKLGALCGYLQTVRGVGYRMEEFDGKENI